MATEKMLRAVISGPAEKLDEAIRSLVLGMEFHPLSASEVLGRGELDTPSGDDPYRPALSAALSLLSKLGVEPQFQAFEGLNYSLEDCEKYISSTSAEAARVITHRNAEMSLAADNEELIARLEPFSLLTVDLEELLGVKQVKLHFGSIEDEIWDEVRAEAEHERGAFLFRSGFREGRVCCILLTLPGEAILEEDRLRDYGFESEDAPNAAGLTGIPAQRIAALRAEADDARRQAGELTAELDALKARERERALSHYSYLRYMSESFGLRRFAALGADEFYLCGWLPSSELEQFQAAADALGCVCSLDKPGHADIGHVPVKFTQGFFSRIFAPFVEMYGPPAYGETDPRLFMLVTYCLLFGLMFGDVGQGVVLVLFGLLLYKKKGMWLGRILAAVGCSAVVFGFVYGSVFGNEHLLPGFKVLEGDGVVTILLSTAGVGVVLILICGVMNILTGFRQKDYRKALFSANGVTGVLFLAGIVSCAASDALFGTGLLSSGAVWFVLALLLLSIWLGEPLVMMLGLAPHEHQKTSVGMMLLEGFFELFEAFLSWLSNCLSFLRVGTYAICHAIMMLIVYALSETSGGYSIFGLVIGNIIVMGIEAALVCIQALRLEFYELFGRFYTGRGKAFEPAHIDYSAPAQRAA
ncbi:MAG: V-type ATP synthase subunit I [Candidatus Scatomorpha sp.]